MNIVVTLKQTFDTEAKIALTSSGSIDDNGVKQVINPYDEYAIEEALKLKEANEGSEVTLVSVGGAGTESAIRTALAMGADQAVLVSDPTLEAVDELVAADILAKAIAQIPYDIILSGRIAVDDGSAQVAVRLAEALGLPSVSSIQKLEITGQSAVATRDIDGGSETIEVPLPAVFTAQKGLNEPRLPGMKGIMAAKKKELKVLTLADLETSAAALNAGSKVTSYSLPTPRSAGKIISGEPAQQAAELAKLLREEAKVI
ncbi:MAG: electron transfer flavoprotein subunit beta/FixA family protein [Clostridiales Family XIII bacterium]|jgi:electron transfer flavoprotein beta subunit|nr:electron transfer flavoprotein subunit beta/FixA family protein [Clostridiales Family XIII bacterium]